MSAEFWNARYAEAGFVYGTEPNDFLREQIGVIAKGGDVLCLAEGEGRNAVFLAQQGFKITAVDLSETGLAKAKTLASERGVTIETRVSDLSVFDYGTDRWDAVISIWAHMPREVRAPIHRQLKNAIKKSGVLILEHYHPDQLSYGTGGPKDADMMLTLAELHADFDGWDFLVANEVERDVHEGGGHSGLSKVTQIVARRT